MEIDWLNVDNTKLAILFDKNHQASLFIRLKDRKKDISVEALEKAVMEYIAGV